MAQPSNRTNEVTEQAVVPSLAKMAEQSKMTPDSTVTRGLPKGVRP